jgi:very-short-patch-repair endonuclease
MPIKISTALLDHAANMVAAGKPIGEACKQIGVSYAPVKRHLEKLGITAVRNTRNVARIELPDQQIAAMYQNGESENAIAKCFGVSRNVIRSRLVEQGITPRTQSEAEALKWAKMSDDQRAAQIESAHDAVRGKPQTAEHRNRIAAARQSSKYDHLIGMGEAEFGQLLTDRGISFTHQKAVESYNLDFAIGNVAVELTADCGRYSMFNPKEIKRCVNLLKCGYRTIAVQFSSIDALIQSADYIIASVDEMSRLESFGGQYWVIGCRLQDYAIVKNERQQFASVPAPIHLVNKRSVIEL